MYTRISRLLLPGIIILGIASILSSVYAANTTINFQMYVDADGGHNPFDSVNYDPATGTNLGKDSGATNGIIRIGDIITYRYAFSVSDADAQNVEIKQWLPSNVYWTDMTQCIGGSNQSITSTGVLLSCVLGNQVAGAQYAIKLKVMIKTGVNGQTLTGQSILNATNLTAPITSNATSTIITGDYPRIQLVQNMDGTTSYMQPNGPNGETGAILTVSSRFWSTKSTSDFGTNATLNVEAVLGYSGSGMNYRLYNWGAGSGGVCGFTTKNYNQTQLENGAYASCSQATPGSPIQLSFTGVNFNKLAECNWYGLNTGGNCAPTTVNGIYPSSIVTGVYYKIWVPESDLASIGSPLNGTTTVRATGSGIWDPTTPTGVSNFGTGVEPLGDNTVSFTLAYPQEGTHFGNVYLGQKKSGLYYANQKPDYVVNLGTVLTGSYMTWAQYVDQNNTFSPKTVILCNKIDPTKLQYTGTGDLTSSIWGSPNYEISAIPAVDRPKIATIIGSGSSTPITLQYSSALYSSGADLKTATCRDTDGPWYDSVTAAGGPSAVTRMRAIVPYTQVLTGSTRVVVSTDVTMVSNLGFPERAGMFLTYSTDSGATWVGNTNATNGATLTGSLADGYYMMNSVYTPMYIYGSQYYGYADNVVPSYLRPTIGHNQVIVNGVVYNRNYTAAPLDYPELYTGWFDPTIPSFRAGDKIEFIFSGSLQDSIDSTAVGDVRIRIQIPKGLTYEFGSLTVGGVQPTMESGYPQIGSQGETLIQFILPAQVVNTNFPTIRYVAFANPLMPTATYLTPYETITASLVQYPDRQSSQFVRFGGNNITSFAVQKMPVKYVVDANTDVAYDLSYINRNMPDASSFQLIDILPYNGDSVIASASGATGRVGVPSNFTGSLALKSLSGSNSEVFEYTKTPPSQIVQDPCHVSNLPLGATSTPRCPVSAVIGGSAGTATTVWCSQADLGVNPLCPANIGETTGVRVTVANPIPGNENKIYSVRMNLGTSGNLPGNIYTNDFNARVENNSVLLIPFSATVQVQGATLTGIVWFDANGNSIVDESATGGINIGLSGATVTARYYSGSVVKTTSVSPSGSYSFTGIPAGTPISLSVSRGAEYTPTYDADGISTPDAVVRTISGTTLGGVNFGYKFNNSATISGQIYDDLNANSILDEGVGSGSLSPVSFSGVMVTLTGTSLTGGIVMLTAFTSPEGAYSFSSLFEGNYVLSSPEIFAYRNTLSNTGFSLGANEIKTNIHFPYVRINLASISGKTLFDIDGDGTGSTVDTPLPNTTVTLSGTNTLNTTILLSTQSDASGVFSFTGLFAGTYALLAGSQSGYVSLGDTEVVLPENTNTTADLLYSAVSGASLAGVAYVDGNTDGLYGTGEEVLPGTQITLSGVTFTGASIALSTTTDMSGAYYFGGLYAGTYMITSHPRLWYNQGSPTTYTETLTAESVTQSRDFPYTPKNEASISGSVYHDVEKNNIRESSNPLLSGVKISLSGTTYTGASLTRETTTDVNGYYEFVSLFSGTYIVSVVPLDGYMLSTMLSASGVILSVNPVEKVTRDFPLVTPTNTVSGIAFIDIDGNGIYTTGSGGTETTDPPMGGATVMLSGTTNTGSRVQMMMATDGPGTYTFAGIEDGNYQIIGGDMGGYTLTTYATFSLVGGKTFTQNIAYTPVIIPPALNTISGIAFIDSNKNGILDAYGQSPSMTGSVELSMSGVRVILSGTTSTGLLVQDSRDVDTNGLYSFSGIFDGTYELLGSTQSGYTITVPPIFTVMNGEGKRQDIPYIPIDIPPIPTNTGTTNTGLIIPPGPGPGGGVSTTVTPFVPIGETTPLPVLSAATGTATSGTPTRVLITDTILLPTQSTITPTSSALQGKQVFSLDKRISEYICPKIVKVWNYNQLTVNDLPKDIFHDDIAALLMFRALEQDEEIHGQTITTYQDQGVAINDDSFETDRDITRAEFVKMIVRSLACRYTYLGKDAGFPDIHPSDWYSEYITFAVKNGWVDGYEDGTFRPDAPITRAEAAKILARAIKLDITRLAQKDSPIATQSGSDTSTGLVQGAPTSTQTLTLVPTLSPTLLVPISSSAASPALKEIETLGSSFIRTPSSIFTDVSYQSVFYPYIEALARVRIMTGRSYDIFAPDELIPRTEASRIIYRTFLGGM